MKLKTAKEASEIYKKLKQQYPDATCALHHKNAYQLAVATILSAQCTDERVNMVTPDLFKAYPDAAALATANQEDVENLIRSTGFYRNKAKSIIGMAQSLIEHHNEKVPDDMAKLVKLPGVGRKTANVVLGNIFGKNEGVVVDTHVKRLSTRLGFTKQDNPEKIEADLMKLIPQKEWTDFAHVLIFHGRQVCNARKPLCAKCVVSKQCPSSQAAP